MEATFSLSRRSCTKPIFTPHLHVDHASYRQPPHSTQSWPTPMTRTHRLTWTVDALPKPKDHSWGGGEPSKSWSSSQGESHYKAWAVNSLPRRRGANGGEDTSPWATAFIAMTAVAACVAGAGIGMRGAMVAPPAAIAALVGLEIIARDVVASEELNGFLQADLRRPSAERVKDATTYVFRCLRDASGSRIDYPDLKENARVVVACGQAEQMMVMLKKKFSEESIRGGEKALELGLIYLEMLILLGRPDDALSFLETVPYKLR